MKKGQFDLLKGLLLGLVILVLTIAIMVRFGQDPGLQTISEIERKATLASCQKVLDGYGKDIYEEKPISGDLFARTVRQCGFCIKREGTNDVYYILDSDEDGIPDECDKEPTIPPRQLKQKHRDQCDGTLVDLYGASRCIEEELKEKYVG